MKPVGEKYEVTAIIPARGGSKGIPKKNIVDLCGKPLIAYTIEAALKTENIDRVIVSTDDPKIAEISRNWGAEVPFIRPSELSTDTAGLSEVVSHAVSELGGPGERKAFVQLYPTSPFRTPEFIDEMLRILFSGYSSVITVKEISFDPRFLFVYEEKKVGLLKIFNEARPRDCRERFFRPYASLQAYLTQKRERHYFHVLTDKCMLIDIDTPRDLRWAEAIIRHGFFDFGF